MRSRFPSQVLAKAVANRFAADALVDLELTASDLADTPLTAEERLAVYSEIRAISSRLRLEAERLYSLL